MARYKAKKLDREGKIFSTKREQFDLSHVHVLHQGVDTLKYLYNGKVNLETYQMIADLFETTRGAIFGFADILWKLTPGGASGYRYKLQNNDLGVIILYGSKHNKIDLERPEHNTAANHFKVELSPHFLLQYTAEEVDQYVDRLVKHFLDDYSRPKLAAHLCADIKGWEIPEDFTENFRTRAHRLIEHNSVSDYDFDLPATTIVHNRNDTITYGKISSLQFQIYDKTKANQVQDKVDLWERQWKKVRDDNFKPIYQKGDIVHRIEYRFHHSVIEQFSRSLSQGVDFEGDECIHANKKIRSFVELEKHLNGIWQYATLNMRLDMSSEYIDPMWCYLMDCVQFHPNKPDFMYRREYKTSGSTSSERNAIMSLANTLSLLVRKGMTKKEIFKAVKKDSYWPDIYNYYMSKGFNTQAIRDHVYNAVDNRVLSGRAV